jgi:hypothetical protein
VREREREREIERQRERESERERDWNFVNSKNWMTVTVWHFPKIYAHKHTHIYETVVWEGELNFTLYNPSSSRESFSPFRAQI